MSKKTNSFIALPKKYIFMKNYFLGLMIFFLLISCKDNALEYNDNLVQLQENLINKLDEISQYQQSLEGKKPNEENYAIMMKKVEIFQKKADSCNEIVQNDDRFPEVTFHKSAQNLFKNYCNLAKSLQQFYHNTQPFLLNETLTEVEKEQLILESSKLQQSVDTVDKWENIFVTEQAKFAKEHKFQLE